MIQYQKKYCMTNFSRKRDTAASQLHPRMQQLQYTWKTKGRMPVTLSKEKKTITIAMTSNQDLSKSMTRSTERIREILAIFQSFPLIPSSLNVLEVHLITLELIRSTLKYFFTQTYHTHNQRQLCMHRVSSNVMDTAVLQRQTQETLMLGSMSTSL